MLRLVSTFLSMGALNAALSYGLYALLVYVGIAFYTANFCAAVFGIMLGYLSGSRVVFLKSGTKRFVKFIALWVSIWLFNVWLIHALKLVGLNLYIAGFVAMFPVTLLSFLGQRFWVFSE